MSARVPQSDCPPSDGAGTVHSMSRIFLDAATSQPLHPEILPLIPRIWEIGWANPDGIGHEARHSRALLESARQTVANVAQVRADQVCFVSAGAEAARLALAGATRTGSRVQYSPLERRVVLDEIDRLVTGPRSVGAAAWSCDAIGRPEFGRSTDEPDVVVTQAANFELGCHTPAPLLDPTDDSTRPTLVRDVTGVLGFTELPADADIMFADAHSWAGPADVGLVIARRRWSLTEPGLAPAVPGIAPDSVSPALAALAAAALDTCHRAAPELTDRLGRITTTLRELVPAHIPDTSVVAATTPTPLAQVVAFTVLYTDAERLAASLDRQGWTVGSGSACSVRSGVASHVLVATGHVTHGNVRVSLPVTADPATVAPFAAVLEHAVNDLRGGPEQQPRP